MRKPTVVIGVLLACIFLVSGHLFAQAERSAAPRQNREGAKGGQRGQRTGQRPEQLFRGDDTKLLTHTVLSDEYAYDDFPSIAAGADGTTWVSYTAFTGMEDEIRVRKYANGKWNTFTRVPGVSGDVWMPKALVDGDGRLWVIWMTS